MRLQESGLNGWHRSARWGQTAKLWLRLAQSSPVKQGTDITQYSRPCEPPLDHQPRHVTHTLSAFTTSQGGEDRHADRQIQEITAPNFVFIYRQTKPVDAERIFIPSVICWNQVLHLVSVQAWSALAGKGTANQSLSWLSDFWLQQWIPPVNISMTIIYQLMHLSPA